MRVDQVMMTVLSAYITLCRAGVSWPGLKPHQLTPL